MTADLSRQCHDAHALRTAGRLLEAETLYRGILARSPGYTEAAAGLAYLLREQGRNCAAAEVIVAHWHALPRSRDTDIKAINFLIEAGCYAAATELVDASVPDAAGDAVLQELAGIVAQANGDFDSAIIRLRAAIDLDSSRAASWLRLVHTRRFSTREDPDLEHLLHAAAQPGRAPELQICHGFALGKVYDDLADYGNAAAAWHQANALAAARAPLDKSRSAAETSGWNWPRIVVNPEARAPLFIVGLPRSGTTLLSRLLGAHAGVRDRGEMNWLPALVARLGERPSPVSMLRARTMYLDQLFQDDAPAAWYIDKNPLNYRHLGAISRLFPEAKVLHVRRSARDVALSLWSQHFAHPDMAWSYRFSTIAGEMARHGACVAKARMQVPDGLWYEVDYEAMVSGGDGAIHALHSWLGLPEAADSARVAAATITTASVWQARQPLYSTSIARWRHYQEYLPELDRFPT